MGPDYQCPRHLIRQDTLLLANLAQIAPDDSKKKDGLFCLQSCFLSNHTSPLNPANLISLYSSALFSSSHEYLPIFIKARAREAVLKDEVARPVTHPTRPNINQMLHSRSHIGGGIDALLRELAALMVSKHRRQMDGTITYGRATSNRFSID